MLLGLFSRKSLVCKPIMSERPVILGVWMARPKSQDKRKSILDAAMDIFAERGIAHAPTSAISKAAGVAEGTLFTYFATKDDLLNELSRELRDEFNRELTDFPYRADARNRMRFVWDRFIDLAMAQPKRLSVVKQLRTSGRLLNETDNPSIAVTLLLHASKEAAAGGQFEQAAAEFLALLFRAHAEATIEFIGAHPEQAGTCRELGFNLFWAGLSAR
jgi:AcrR family transcriptional regulator